ncbi:MAG: L,D-transpeptidase, partial [Muribaculaceae bacterium]|nr:L,D-transpeptidase [Muribaculaceae bacterium]
LLTPGHSGIGIHGSTNNESSVPGRASEGCIRLRDADIITLKENYAYVGMPVYIKAEGEGLYPWEK